MKNQREIKFKCFTECEDKHIKLGFPKNRWAHYDLIFGKRLFPEYKQISPDLQFTGLQDKNGVDIYEGDIVLCKKATPPEDNGFVCKWDLNMFTFYNVNFLEDLFYSTCDFDYISTNCEVIGNIYENKELLK